MADSTSPSPPSSLSHKRPHEDSVVNNSNGISNDLSPSSQLSLQQTSKSKLPPRERKESAKKKEASLAAAGFASPSATKPDQLAEVPNYTIPQLQRMNHFPPQTADYHGAKPPIYTPSPVPSPIPSAELFILLEHPRNRRGYRYAPCQATKILPCVSYRLTEVPPFHSRISFEDMAAQIHLDRTATIVTTEKGFRTARANVCVREGNWYYEVKILRGINSPEGGDGHVRIGWARREAPHDAPVGFDAYSYGLRDVDGQKVHMSRPKDFAKGSFVTGDVIGLQICLPSIKEQRELILSNLPPGNTSAARHPLKTGDIVRDRIPIRYKNQLYFEQFEYSPTKEMEDLMNPVSIPESKSSTTAAAAADKNKSVTPLKLPKSFIKVYKNGKLLGTPWEGLYAFLPPHSRPLAPNSRELDDGTCGYFPTVSVFRRGTVQINFGPDFEFPQPLLSQDPEGPEEDTKISGKGKEELKERNELRVKEEVAEENQGEKSYNDIPPIRPICERYNEMIAEDIVYDVVDEVDLLFTEVPGFTSGKWAVGSRKGGKDASSGRGEELASGDVTPNLGVAVGGEIKEMVMEEE